MIPRADPQCDRVEMRIDAKLYVLLRRHTFLLNASLRVRRRARLDASFCLIAEQDHREQQNGSVNDASYRLRQRRRLQHAAHGGEQECAAENADVMAAAAGNPRSTQNDNCNRSQQIRLPHVVIGLVGKAGQHETYDRGTKTTENIHRDGDRSDVDAREPRHPFAVADCADAAGEATMVEHQGARHDK